MKNVVKKTIPAPIFRIFQSAYHFLLALASAIIYNRPSRSLFVVGVTGTKGKSSTTEILNAIFEEADWKTALSNTIRFKIGDESLPGNSVPNTYKMSMPGHFFMQKFLSRAKKAGCTHAIIEITSEGAKQFRNKFIELDAFIFTNLAPEHIESHGSYENYRDAKISIAKEIEKSPKPQTYTVINMDDPESFRFMSITSDNKIGYSLRDAEPYSIHGRNGDSTSGEDGNVELTFKGTKIVSKLRGLFNLQNILAAASLASALGISNEIIRSAIEKISGIKGRVERVDLGQDFEVIVDYAHTPDSLEKLYQTFRVESASGAVLTSDSSRKLICVLGNTGGGRDSWKRPEMGKIADKYCDQIILTNEDPYDENPQKIVDGMKVAITNKPCEIILDRRIAIARALALAREWRKGSPGMSGGPGGSDKLDGKAVVLISGKGTDPYIMEARGKKTPWSDVEVVREELGKLQK